MRQRYLRQRLPWIAIEASDLYAVGDPETAVFLSDSTLVGLHIKGLEGHLMLGIREDAHGQPVSCAITNEIQIDARAAGAPFNAPYFDHIDGVSDEDP